jgi:hypothetical protein
MARFVAADATAHPVDRAALSFFHDLRVSGLRVVPYWHSGAFATLGSLAVTAGKAGNRQRCGTCDQQDGDGFRFHDDSNKLFEDSNAPG